MYAEINEESELTPEDSSVLSKLKELQAKKNKRFKPVPVEDYKPPNGFRSK